MACIINTTVLSCIIELLQRDLVLAADELHNIAYFERNAGSYKWVFMFPGAENLPKFIPWDHFTHVKVTIDI